jgi:hypothetical protein
MRYRGVSFELTHPSGGCADAVLRVTRCADLAHQRNVEWRLEDLRDLEGDGNAASRQR